MKTERREALDIRSPTRLANVALVAIIGAATMLRMPEVIQAPRFWAEEGQHFSAAFGGNLFEALFFVYWRAGYFNLIANLGAALAAALPLRLAPAGTVFVSLIVQIIPVCIVLGARGGPFSSPLRRSGLILALLVLPTMTHEIWLNTINSQIFLGLSALLILLDESSDIGTARRVSYRTILLLGGLSGPYAIFLQPAFLLRSLISRRREHFVQTGLITAALFAQVAIGLIARSQGLMNEKRVLSFGWRAIADIPLWHFSYPFFGVPATSSSEFGGPLGYAYFILLLIGLLILGWDGSRSRFVWRRDQILLLAGYMCWVGGILVTAHHGQLTGRYAVAPSFAVVAFVLTSVWRRTDRRVSTALILVLLFGLLKGLLGYRLPAACHGQFPRPWAEAVIGWESKNSVDVSLPICPAGWEMSIQRGAIHEAE